MKTKLFRIIPVVDLKSGVVVHARRGEREKYQPVNSVLTESAELLPIVSAFNLTLGLKEVYVADLDAIATAQANNNLALLSQIRRQRSFLNDEALSLLFMVDAGISTLADAAQVFSAGADQIVVGTETLTSIAALRDIIHRYGSRRVTLSLDMRDSHILSPAPDLRGLEPPQAITRLRMTGIEQFILLELSRVGTGAGLNCQLIQDCLVALGKGIGNDSVTKPELLIGGGVSGISDLEWLKQVGVSGALIATALHDGRLTSENLIKLKEDFYYDQSVG